MESLEELSRGDDEPLPVCEDAHPINTTWSEMAATRVEARGQVTDIFVPHPYFEAVSRRIDLILDVGAAANDSEAPALLLTGYSRAGKSTLLKKAIQRRGFDKRAEIKLHDLPYARSVKLDFTPIVHFKVPDDPTVRTVSQRILKALGDRYWYEELNPGRLSQKVIDFLKAVRPHALWADDLHRAVDRAGTAVSESLADWLMTLLDETAVPQILGGIHRTRYLFRFNEQLKGRYNTEVELKPYRCFEQTANTIVPVAEKFEIFAGVLSAFVALCPLELGIDVTEELVVLRFYYATRGLIGYVKRILRRAVEITLEDNERLLLDLALLERAFDDVVHKDPLIGGETLVNPFSRLFAPQLPPPLKSDSQFGMSRHRRRETKKEYIAEVTRSLTK